jgi:Ca2+-binding EF-hand superfamily protein
MYFYNLFFIIFLVYFDLYDVDGDGKISKKDLKSFLSIINTKDENDTETINQDEDSDISIENFMEPMIDMIFREIVFNTKRSYIDFREFNTLMWHTNIDKTCVMYLEEE